MRMLSVLPLVAVIVTVGAAPAKVEDRSASAEAFDLLSLLTQLGLQGAQVGLPILGPIALDAAGAAAGAGLDAAGGLLGRSDLIDVEDRSKSASAEDFDLLSLINLLNTLVNTFGALTGSTGTISGTTGTTGTAIRVQ